MNYEEFKRMLENELKKHLPSDYMNAEIRFETLNKLGNSYEAMTVRKPGQSAVVAMNITQFYKEYMEMPIKGWILDTIADAIIENENITFNNADLTEYEAVKDRLFIRLSNAEYNENLLSTVPHRIVEDLAVTYHIQIQGPVQDGLYSTIVNNTLLEQYGVTADQLHEDAMINSPRLFPPTLRTMREVLMGCGVLPDEPGSPKMYVLSNPENINGAAALMYENAMEEAAKVLDGDYVVLPSSVHEVILLPDNGSLDYSELEQMVIQVNNSIVKQEDKLSDHVYKYDAMNHQFSMINASQQTFDLRQKEDQSMWVDFA